MEDITVTVSDYTYEDFATTDKPYMEVYASRQNAFIHDLKRDQMSKKAKDVGFTTFRSAYKAFCSEQRKAEGKNGVSYINETTILSPYITLYAGKYNVDNSGVYTVKSEEGNESITTICHQPIFPFEVLKNVDTGEEKLNIAYKDRGVWHEIIVPKDTIYNSRNITKLVKNGIDVSSETAKDLVCYFQEIETLNRDVLPLVKSVNRLGYIGTEGFSPYVKGLKFDGEESYKHIYMAIKKQGNYEAWKKTAIECRKGSVTAKILLAASFASALIEPLGGLPFFVHLWGIDSGTGKTVALMLAASVWGSPKLGDYIQTFNSTEVGHERMIAFFNSLPFLIDELQLAKDNRGKSNFNVYKLGEGQGRARGNKYGGVEKTPTWRNAILTTGETPITSNSSGAGAKNRVINIECTTKNVVIANGREVAAALNKNFGFAGEEFVKIITAEGTMKKLQAECDENYHKLIDMGITGKQALSAAIILTADFVASGLIFGTKDYLTIDDISQFLLTEKAASAGERGYQYICDWVSLNVNKFSTENEVGEIYGYISDGVAYIIRAAFNKAVGDQGFDERALLSWLRKNELIIYRDKNNTVVKRFRGNPTTLIALKLPEGEKEYYTKEELENVDDLGSFELL